MISDRQDTIRMYPALNIEESALREGLQIMEDAIRHVENHGRIEGDTAACPCGAG
jgi:acetylornithine/succinyldiaminopimelate/putrescine aminotransferase